MANKINGGLGNVNVERSTGASTNNQQRTPANGAPGSVSISTDSGNRQPLENYDMLNSLDINSDESSTNPISEIITPKLDLNVAINNYNPIQTLGFTEQRPEIIGEFNFEPVYDDSSINSDANKNAVGDMLETQTSIRQLRAENITKLLSELKTDEEASRIIENLEKRLQDDAIKLEDEVKFLSDSVLKLNDAKRALSVKTNLQFIKNEIGQNRTFLASQLSSDDPVKSVVVNTLGFTDAGYDSFSDSKILMQLCSDLLDVTKSYTPSLINRVNSRRDRDVDPFYINRFTDSTAGITNNFNINSLKSRPSDIFSILQKSGVENFNNNIRSLSDGDDKIKMLFAILSRELRVSAGLSIQSIRQNIINVFGLSEQEIDNDVFEKIIGKTGASIFDSTTGVRNSLVKLLRIESGNDIIFPFESTFIKKQGIEPIPGHKFYVDSIIKGTDKLNSTSFSNYAYTFGTVAQTLANVIESTFDVNVVNTQSLGLNADDMFVKFLKTLSLSLSEISTRSLGPVSFSTDQNPAASRDTFTPALLAAAADDPTLKHMLTLYVMVVGSKIAYEPGAQPSIFKTILESQEFLRQSQNNSLGALDIAVASAAASVIEQPVSQYGSRQSGDGTDDVVRNIRNSQHTAQTIDTISAAIIARLLDLQASNTSRYGDSRYDRVVEYRIFDKLSTLGSGDSTFLLKGLVELISSFDTFARNASNLYLTNTALTRFNQLGAHTIIRIVIEIFTTFFKMFPIATFAGATTAVTLGSGGKEFTILRNDELLNEINEALKDIVSTTGFRQSYSANRFMDVTTRDRATRVQGLIDRFSTIKSRFSQEDQIIKRIVAIFAAIGNGLKFESNNIKQFFDKQGQNKNVINALLQASDSNEKFSALDFAQTVLSRNALIESKSNFSTVENIISANNGEISPFIDDTVISQKIKKALDSLLQTTQFVAPAGNNIRILSVGLPAGFISALNDRTGPYTIGQNFSEFSKRLKIRSDVIKIHVYLKDLMFENLVFKPQSFIFQTTRFVSSDCFNFVETDVNQTFDNLSEQLISTRVLSDDFSKFIIEGNTAKGFAGIATSKSYDGIINDFDKKELINNHIKSYLLNVYIKLLTGVELSEDAYYINDDIADTRVDSETQAAFEELLLARVSKFANRRLTFDELRNTNKNVRNLLERLNVTVEAGAINPLGTIIDDASKTANIEISEDILTMMKMFSSKSILFGFGARKMRTTSPKLFERIFNIPIDPDDFEIDQDATRLTMAGRDFLGSTAARSIVISQDNSNLRDLTRVSLDNLSPLKLDPILRREIGNVNLQQFFVAVEQLPELQQISYTNSLNSSIRGNLDINRDYGGKENRRINDQIPSAPPRADADPYDAVPDGGFIDWSKLV